MRMQILDIITKKKLGQQLTLEEIPFFARGAADKTIPDYQLAALLMAIRLNAMTAQETTDLTLAMRDSGDVCDLSAIPGKKIGWGTPAVRWISSNPSPVCPWRRRRSGSSGRYRKSALRSSVRRRRSPRQIRHSMLCAM